VQTVIPAQAGIICKLWNIDSQMQGLWQGEVTTRQYLFKGGHVGPPYRYSADTLKSPVKENKTVGRPYMGA